MAEFQDWDKLNSQAQKIAHYIVSQTGYCEPAELVALAYNFALEDVESFIDTMIEKNPEYRIAFERLKLTMLPGMKLGPNTK